MKKFWKISGSFVLFLTALLISIPYIFESKIKSEVQKTINNNLNAKVQFSDFSLSLFRSFPDLNFKLEQLSIVGKQEFDGDTLATFETFQTNLALFSVLGDEIKVKSIFINRPFINAKVTKTGKANWDIMLENQTGDKTQKDTSNSDFKVALKKIIIKKAHIIYDDKQLATTTELINADFEMNGDLTETLTNLKIISEIDSLNVDYEGIRYMNKVNTKLKAIIEADLEKYKFTFKDNSLHINNFPLFFQGWVEMPASDIAMDITFSSPATEFKPLLSLIPAIYMKDFQGLQASGNLAFNGFVKGIYNDESMPLYGVDLQVEKGSFHYPDLPESVENVNTDIHIESKDETGENMDINIKKFHVEMAQNPFDAVMIIKMTQDDVDMKGNINGHINLTSIKDFIPLENTSIKGSINTNLKFAGKLSDIENEKYQNFTARGQIEMKDCNYVDPDYPEGIRIHNALLDFSPAFIELSGFHANIQQNDLQLNGKVNHYLPYIFSDDLLTARLNLSSNYMNVNDFLSSDTEEETGNTQDTTTLQAFKIPENIDFVFTSKFKKLIYDKLTINNIHGSVKLQQGILELSGLDMELLDGSMTMHAKYDSRDMSQLNSTFSMDMNRISIPKAFYAFNTIQQIAPLTKHCKGNISANIELNTQMDNQLNPKLNTLDAKGKFESENIGIKNAKVFDLMANKLKDEKYKAPTLKNVDVSFTIEDGNIEVKPFDVKFMGNQAQISGTQNLDQRINYTINLRIPRDQFGESTNSLIEEMFDKAKQRGVNITPSKIIQLTVVITGKLQNPKMKLKLTRDSSSSVDDLKENVKEEVKEKVEEAKSNTLEKAHKKADELLKKAKKEKETIMKKANQQADKLRKEVKEKKEKVLSEARKKGPIAEKLAEKTVNKMEKETNEKIDKILKEAEQRADEKIQDAKDKGDELIEEAKNK